MFASFASRCACATLLAATLLAGCTDELKYRKGDPANGSIGFNARLMSGWVNTRAEQCDRPYVSDVTGGEAIADSLFLNMTTTPGVMTGTYDLRHAEGLEYDTDRKGEGIVTRATPVTPDNGEMYTDFGVSAYSYQGDWDEATATPDYFYNLKASKSSDGKYTLPATYFWPGPNYKMRFFAVAPYNNPYYVVSGQEQPGTPKISVDVPGNVGNQKDLLIATSGELDGNTRKDVDLQFMHPLTAVRFVVGDDMSSGTINKINIHNVYCKGDLDLSSKQWTLNTEKRTFYQSIGQTVANQGDGNAKPGTEIGTASQTFMMMPQTLPEDAMISMEIKVGTTIYTVSAPIAGQVWQPGTTVTYQLSTTSINWTYTLTGGVYKIIDDYSRLGQIYIQSFRTHLTGVKEAVPLDIEYSSDNGASYSADIPTNLIIEPLRNSILKEYYTVGIGDEDAINLKKNPVEGKDVPYNLSNSIGGEEIENTANCYVVKAAGHYRLPLVYGNAIKNGAPNPASYTAKTTGTNVLAKLINHNGVAITDPYIYNNANCVPTACNLIWQTGKNVIKNWKLDANKEFIEFEVDQNMIMPSNAILTVTNNSGVVMWSWHIWITSVDTQKTTTIKGSNPNYTHHIMNLRLGQIGYNGNFPQNSIGSNKVIVKLSNKLQSVEIPIEAKYSTKVPEAPLYLWGRKDPIVIMGKRADVAGYRLITAYNNVGTTCNTYDYVSTAMGSTYASTISAFIKYPNRTVAGKNYSYAYCNLWDNAQSTYGTTSVTDADNKARTDTEIKTIYDPCPPGFNVMCESAYAAFLGTNIEYSSDLFGHFATTKADKVKFWFLELGVYDYSGGPASHPGKGSHKFCNRNTGYASGLEFSAGRHYGTAPAWTYSRAMMGHCVYCQRESR